MLVSMQSNQILLPDSVPWMKSGSEGEPNNQLDYWFQPFCSEVVTLIIQLLQTEHDLYLFISPTSQTNYFYNIMVVWFKYFNKDSWKVRIWRNSNLKFNADDLGMFRVKYIKRYKDLLFRMARCEGAMRGAAYWFYIPLIFIVSGANEFFFGDQAKLKKQKEKQTLIDSDKLAAETLFLNKMKSPTRPLRTFEELLLFLAGSEIMDDLTDFISYTEAEKINQDQMKGLDSWLSPTDENILQYYKKNVKSRH